MSQSNDDNDFIAEGQVPVDVKYDPVEDLKQGRWDWIPLSPGALQFVTSVNEEQDYPEHLKTVTEAELLDLLNWISQQVLSKTAEGFSLVDKGIVKIESKSGFTQMFMLRQGPTLTEWVYVCPFIE